MRTTPLALLTGHKLGVLVKVGVAHRDHSDMEVLAVTIVVHHDVADLAAEVRLRESARIRGLDAAGLRPSAAHAAAEFLVVRHFRHHMLVRLRGHKVRWCTGLGICGSICGHAASGHRNVVHCVADELKCKLLSVVGDSLADCPLLYAGPRLVRVTRVI